MDWRDLTRREEARRAVVKPQMSALSVTLAPPAAAANSTDIAAAISQPSGLRSAGGSMTFIHVPVDLKTTRDWRFAEVSSRSIHHRQML